MRIRRAFLPLVGLLAGGAMVLAAEAAKARVEPQASSVHPFTGNAGSIFVATVRGSGLGGVTSVFFDGAPIAATVEGLEEEPPEPGARNRKPVDLLRLRFEIAAETEPGRYPFRLVTPGGISNALEVHVTPYPVAAEPEAPHDWPEQAVPVTGVPAVITGRIDRMGESDYYALEAQAGQTFTFEVISGLPSTGAPGGNARGFDPSISIYEPSGSWFDPKRVNRIAFNDEPLWVIGRLTDAHLTHTFSRVGRYLVRVEAFSGQGGPDYSYQLKILPGAAPPDTAPERPGWAGRSFTRRLSANRLNELAARGGKPEDRPSIETYRALPVPVAEAPTFQIPGTLVGALEEPGETHRARFKLEGPADLAIEVETPELAPPEFNPVVRLLDGAGEEVVTNVFAGKGACTGALTKALQAKAIVPVRDPGDYWVEIRDTTADLAAPGFRYRVQVRPQAPHVGQVNIAEDRVNLAPGEARTVRIVFDREEGYQGAIAVLAEGLPPGVSAVAGADFEPDKDPPMHPGRRERYIPRTERSVLVFTAASDAAATGAPEMVKVTVRPVVDGRLGVMLAEKRIPLMVVAK
jgi:hypothetical protein